MKYLSVCSGIEAATVAWHPLGWAPVGFSEIEKFPSSVLAHHYSTIENYGDMNDYQEWPGADIDVLVGGTPCQSFSVAGLRAGMADPRGNLALVYLAIAQRYRPDWLVWENVPGVLSSDGGRDFAAIIGGMVKLGYGIAYRVFNAEYFGVPQRRRRVFVVGYLGDWRGAAEVLFEPACLRRDPPPSRGQGQRSAAGLTAGSNPNSNAAGRRREDDENLIPVAFNFKASASQSMNPGQIAPTLDRSKPEGTAVAFAQNQLGEVRTGKVVNTLNTNSNASGRNTPMVQENMAVRRLTPLECERLQGFPDGYTDIPGSSDTGRYKALGNSMAVPVMSWIGKRIAAAHGR